MRLKLAGILAALSLTAVFASSASAEPHDYFPNPCGRPVTGVWDSYETGHSWIGVWTGTDVARGAPSDGVWRLYAAAVDAGAGWQFAYYYWTSCYY